MINANDRLDFIEEVYSCRIRQSSDVTQNSASLAHLPALVHRVDAGRLELLELIASLVAGAQRHLALGTEADGERSIYSEWFPVKKIRTLAILVSQF